MKKAAPFLAVLMLFLFINPKMGNSETINVLPFEDVEFGKNSNAYLSINGTLSIETKKKFVGEMTTYAKEANEKWGIPASAIIGMVIVESGYGTTRIAINANNIFAIKVWGLSPKNAWQLKGQPNEDYEAIPVLSDYGYDRIVYDETQRRDNWYRMFGSYKEAVNYLAGNILSNQRYGFAQKNYENKLKSGMSSEEAAKQFVYEIADAGYNHLGGIYYRDRVGKTMDEWNLYQYDNVGFKDVHGHWAEKEINYLAEKGWISGYSDGTFRPYDTLTRAQAAKIISYYLNLSPTSEKIHFNDVKDYFWGVNTISLVAQHKVMNGIGNGNFAPNAELTRAQMAQLFYNARINNQPVEHIGNSFSDVSTNHWARIPIETMEQGGIMSGYSDGRFGPNDPITRAQMAAVIYRLNGRINK